MSKKKLSKLQRNAFLRSMTVSVAGARTGSAMLADGALNQLIPGRNKNRFLKKQADNFAAELGRLKGTYVKVGQMMALLGEHLLPPEMTEALHSLESQTSPLDWAEIEPVIKRNLGENYALLSIEKEPIAAASLAQIHRAVINATGENICLKVLYPGVKDTIDADFNAVVRMLKLSRMLKSSKDMTSWFESIRSRLYREVDYDHEIVMTQKMAALVENDTRYHVPKVYLPFCAPELIALEYVEGVKVTDENVSNLSLERRNQLAKSMLDLFFYEVYQWNLIQTDSNFGNYLVSIDEKKDRLVLLDFGSVTEPENGFTDALGNTIHAAQADDIIGVIAGLTDLGCLEDDSAEAAKHSFAEFCLGLLEPLKDAEKLPEEYLNARREYRWGYSELVRRIGKRAAKSTANRDFTLPSEEFAFIATKLTGVFTFISVLDAEFNGAELLLAHKH